MSVEAIVDEARLLDERLGEQGPEVWIGGQPTFTRRESQESFWLHDAEGGDKEERARALLVALAPRMDPRAALLRIAGRLHADEPAPRFCFGAVFRRDGLAVRSGPREAGLDGPVVEAPEPCSERALLTVTPDYGVVDVRLPPTGSLATFFAWARDAWRSAEEAGLSPLRFRYSGVVADSGGGGRITLGGPSPEESPFFEHPSLLPSLLRYLNHHPSLSYWFAPECAGSAGEGPRPDEGLRERFEELAVALDRLDARGDDVEPLELWETLAPLLVDGAGNAHRAEVNVERLYDPLRGARGKLGVVELRALRMEATPERMTCVAALFRALLARLVAEPFREPLVDWGAALHDRFALPHLLRRDLLRVLDDLATHGAGLGPAMRAELLAPRPPIASLDVGPATLVVSPALEFWPLIGDVTARDRPAARLVDASSERVEVLVRTKDAGGAPGRVSACGAGVPLEPVDADDQGGAYVAGIRYRTFEPKSGLHPGLEAHDPLAIVWEHGNSATSIALHGWIPGGGAYDGLPCDEAEAARRRRERVVIRSVPLPASWKRPALPAGRVTVDLRRVAVRRG